jgi:hypothetical protein
MELVLIDGHAKLEDGKPVYRGTGGEEFAFDAAEVEKKHLEQIEALKAEAETAKAEAETAKLQLHQEKVGGSFARSKFREEKMIPGFSAEKAARIYGHHFKVLEGRVVGHDEDGKKLYSRTRPGEIADFDEALGIIVNADPDRDNILLFCGGTGGGALGGAVSATSRQITGSPIERITGARQAGITK